MACFTVPLAEALIVTVGKSIAFRSADDCVNESKKAKLISIKEKISVLEKMLYGGSFLLAVEHFYHGELSLLPPFLTAVKNPAEISGMLHELATTGLAMALLTTAVWAAGCGIHSLVKKIRERRTFAAKTA